MAGSRFVAENGLISSGNSIFEQQVTVQANLSVQGDLLYVGANLYVQGNQIITGTTVYDTDIVPSSSGKKVGNTTYQYIAYLANTNISGITTTTANVNINASLTANDISSNSITAVVAANNQAFVASSGVYQVLTIPNANTYWNPLISANDSVIIASGTSANSGNLVIGTYTSRVEGFGVKLSSSNYDISLKANTVSLGSSGLSANGSLGTAGFVLCSNGTATYWAATAASGVTAIYTANGVSGGPITSTGTIGLTAANGISVTASGINVLAGNTQLVSNTTGVFIDQTMIDHNSLSNYTANKHIDHSTVSITAGAGLSGGGTIAATRTVAVSAGNTQVVANTLGVFIDQTMIDHNSLSNYTANKHIDHSTVSITAGAGLSGGGTIAATRSLSVNTSYIATLTSNNSSYLGGLNNTQFLRSDANTTYTGGIFAVETAGAALGSSTLSVNTGKVLQSNTTTGDAFINIELKSRANVYFGLDGTTNDLFVGGGSFGANKYKVWHAGNDGAASTLDADLLDGQHGSYYTNATNISSGTLGTARMGSGTANTTTYLRGDGSWQTGPLGYTGSAGTNGYTGSAGTNGSTGYTGSLGYTGSAGTNGYTGSAGTNGSTGYTGSLGYTGSGYGTTANVQMGSLGVGTTASGVTGEIRATGDITSGYSDRRLKDIEGPIDDPLDKVNKLTGIYFKTNDLAKSLGFNDVKRQVGVIAQDVNETLPEVVSLAPFDSRYFNKTITSVSGENYLTVQYDKLVPLLIEAIKELASKVEELEKK